MNREHSGSSFEGLTLMKKVWLTLLGAAVLSTTLSLTVSPAFALGDCGKNYHRDRYGKCVFGGQNEDYCLKTKGHPATREPNGTMVCK
jgi:hypothetical protein